MYPVNKFKKRQTKTKEDVLCLNLNKNHVIWILLPLTYLKFCKTHLNTKRWIQNTEREKGVEREKRERERKREKERERERKRESEWVRERECVSKRERKKESEWEIER